jgi:zinc transport system permease protein
MDTLVQHINAGIDWLCLQFPVGTFFWFDFNMKSFFAVLMVSFICGAVGSLVVGNRMAFFSDALAHCAFAGVSLGLLIALALRVPNEQFRDWITAIMVAFGIVVGLLIAFVRERTGLASDTVIGVFFAGAIGLAAVFSRIAPSQFSIESFIFGQPAAVKTTELLYLLGLFLLTGLFLARSYNDSVLASVNPSLALSRNVRVRLNRYLFIVLLGLIVNVCLQVVGALLINGLLLVPAATAANVCRNLRRLFWVSVGLCAFCGVGGLLISWEVFCNTGWQLGPGGTIVVVSVLLFVASMIFGPVWRDRPTAAIRAD